MDWQPIETAPQDGTWLLAIMAGTHPDLQAPYTPAVVRWLNDDDFVGWTMDDEVDGTMRFWKPTHWMPLPTPPAA